MVRSSRLTAAHLALTVALASAAAPALAQNTSKNSSSKETVDTCTMPYGTIAINEPHEQSMIWLRTYQLGSPSSLLRTFAQKSNCFVVVERGVGMQNITQERSLASSGELQSGQNFGKGQIVAADYLMTPVDPELEQQRRRHRRRGRDARRRAGAIVGGGLKFKEADDQHHGGLGAHQRPDRGQRGPGAPARLRARRHLRRRRPARRRRRLLEHGRGQGDRRQPARQLQRRRRPT